MKALNAKQRKHLRSLAHNLKPVVMMGQQGLHDALIDEINLALDHHELIKVKLAADKEDRLALTQAICDKTKATCVQNIGHIAILYRVSDTISDQKRITLPKG